ncbi:OsmC family protein [Anseongella ginsenosidimutans]|nr:OsmC family protein [Anseongella ginsenosidimutans]
MAQVTAVNGKENYLIEISSPTGNKVTADEPLDKGGRNKGFSPKELLASALAACTSATVRMFAARKEWELRDVKINIELLEEDGKTTFRRTIKFEGNLDNAQQQRLFMVANACPVHKILTNNIVVDSTMKRG